MSQGESHAMRWLFRRAANAAVINRLYLAIVEASRCRALYLARGGAATVEGRVVSLSLHAVLVVRRLQACPPPGRDMAQHLVDVVFKHFDRTLREMGVGDTSVPKRMKTMAEAFLGRSAAYEAALRDGQDDALVAALARNVYSGRHDAEALARYAAATAAMMDGLSLQQLIDGSVAFADPAAFATESAQ